MGLRRQDVEANSEAGPLRRQEAEANGNAGPQGTQQERRVKGKPQERLVNWDWKKTKRHCSRRARVSRAACARTHFLALSNVPIYFSFVAVPIGTMLRLGSMRTIV